MPVQEVNMDENNMQWTRFKPTPIIPVYFIVAGLFHFTSETNQSFRLLCRAEIKPHVQFAYSLVKNITQFLKELPYIRKTPEENHIAIPGLFDAEEIMLGSVLYREEDIIFNQETDDKMRKIEIARVIGYKVVHEWFYNGMDPYKWEPWLSKGFATFLGIYIANKTEIMTSLNTIMWKMKYPNFQSDRLSQENVFTKCLKQEAARWLCTTNHDNCLLTAKNELNQYLSTYTNRTKWFAATHYQTIATRRLFPLLKDTLYASYNISIKHHKHYRAFSNMPVQEINMDENNMQWTRFKSTPVMPVYFIAVSIAHVALTSETNQAIKLWCRTDIISYVQFAYTAAKDIAQYLDKAFPHMSKGSPETNHIVIPKLLNEEDIKFGFVLYGEKNIMFNEKIDSDIRRVEITRVMGYKVVHEWFYNAIDPYMWEVSLSKGFATFFGIFATDKIFPHLRIQDFFVVQMQHDVLHWRTKNTWPFPLIVSTYDIDTTFEIPSYIKDKNDWILANLQQTECYRVNYDAENWNRLSKYLNSNTFRKIHVLDRAKIIDDTFHFMMTGQLNSTIFFNISHYLLRDIDYIAWYPMFKSLEYMSGFFKFPESAFMKTEILHLLNGIYLEILNTNFNGDKSTDSRLFTECLKQEATKWLCTLNHNDCLHTANRDLTWHLYSHKNYLPNKEADIIFNQEIDDEIRKFEITQVVAYKVIYEWLYDAIDPSKKLDFWLSKGFATFLGNYVANKIFRHFRIHDFSLVQMQQAVLHWSTKDTWPLTTESGLNSSFEIPRYIKGR
ncbi:Laeverin [Camponotus floridanus]|uniref:Laeverin n=1 Tax=Camponotus floridanus TaxID=104421 RepID=E2AHL2_CAMFO|nr:Laeverin [Camponotus floridanus]